MAVGSEPPEVGEYVRLWSGPRYYRVRGVGIHPVDGECYLSLDSGIANLIDDVIERRPAPVLYAGMGGGLWRERR